MAIGRSLVDGKCALWVYLLYNAREAIENSHRMSCMMTSKSGFLRVLSWCVVASLMLPNGRALCQEPILHFVGIADTDAAGIGKHVSAALSKVASALLMRLPDSRRREHPALIGPDCNIEKIHQTFESLTVTPGDTVVVYYVGHGGYDPNFGTLLLPTLNPGKGMPLRAIGEQLEKKQPTRIIFLIDCCQTPVNGQEPSVPRAFGAGIALEVPPLEQSLFFESEPGTLALFAAERGVAVPCGVPMENGIAPGTLFSDAFNVAMLKDSMGGVGWIEFGKRVKSHVNQNFAKFPRDGKGRLILSPGNQRIRIESQKVWALHVSPDRESKTLISP